jgi:hypothetical protein
VRYPIDSRNFFTKKMFPWCTIYPWLLFLDNQFILQWQSKTFWCRHLRADDNQRTDSYKLWYNLHIVVVQSHRSNRNDSFPLVLPVPGKWFIVHTRYTFQQTTVFTFAVFDLSSDRILPLEIYNYHRCSGAIHEWNSRMH